MSAEQERQRIRLTNPAWYADILACDVLGHLRPRHNGTWASWALCPRCGVLLSTLRPENRPAWMPREGAA